jgi:hypothetical protein
MKSAVLGICDKERLIFTYRKNIPFRHGRSEEIPTTRGLSEDLFVGAENFPPL